MKPQTHRVQRGESLYSIAKQYNMTVNELKQLNDLNSNNLQAGQKLKVSTDDVNALQKTQENKPIIHKVKRGETLSSIAQKYGCKISDIKKWNNRTSDRLNVGDKLTIRKN